MFEMGDWVEVTPAYTADWEYIPQGSQGEVVQAENGEILVKLDLFDRPVWIPDNHLRLIRKLNQ
ncbi:MAG TPA: hypothetical protein VMT46_17720 [Anaerolineaceae bacterium]|nr:hypothetical protein [Anaerolineaceae bacterium]